MIGVYRHWATIERPAAYLNRAVLNGCRDAGRRDARQRRLVRRLAEEPVDVSPREVLDDVLAALPFNQRAAVVLRYFESMPTAEIAIRRRIACRDRSDRGSIEHSPRRAKGPGMTDLEDRLRAHLRHRATLVAPDPQPQQVRAGVQRGEARARAVRRSSVAPPRGGGRGGRRGRRRKPGLCPHTRRCIADRPARGGSCRADHERLLVRGLRLLALWQLDAAAGLAGGAGRRPSSGGPLLPDRDPQPRRRERSTSIRSPRRARVPTPPSHASWRCTASR